MLKRAMAIALMLVGCVGGNEGLEPFRIGADGFLPEAQVMIVEEAVERLNAELGFEAVDFDPTDYSPAMRGMMVNEPAPAGYFAWTNHYNGNYNCAVLIGKLGTKEANREADVYTAMHEILHCLGIRHVEDREALMYKDRVVGSAKTISDEVRESVIEYLESNIERTSK